MKTYIITEKQYKNILSKEIKTNKGEKSINEGRITKQYVNNLKKNALWTRKYFYIIKSLGQDSGFGERRVKKKIYKLLKYKYKITSDLYKVQLKCVNDVEKLNKDIKNKVYQSYKKVYSDNEFDFQNLIDDNYLKIKLKNNKITLFDYFFKQKQIEIGELLLEDEENLSIKNIRHYGEINDSLLIQHIKSVTDDPELLQLKHFTLKHDERDNAQFLVKLVVHLYLKKVHIDFRDFFSIDRLEKHIKTKTDEKVDECVNKLNDMINDFKQSYGSSFSARMTEDKDWYKKYVKDPYNKYVKKPFKKAQKSYDIILIIRESFKDSNEYIFKALERTDAVIEPFMLLLTDSINGFFNKYKETKRQAQQNTEIRQAMKSRAKDKRYSLNKLLK